MRVLCSAMPASGRQHALGSSHGVRRPVPAAVGAVRRPLPVRRCSAVTPLGGAVKPQRSGFMDDVEYSDWQEGERPSLWLPRAGSIPTLRCTCR